VGLGDEVVDFVARDGDFGKFSRGERFLEKNFSVDVGGIGFGAGGVGGVDQNPELFSNKGSGPLNGDFLLGGHGFAIA